MAAVAKKKKRRASERRRTAGRSLRVRPYEGNRLCQRCRLRGAEFRIVLDGDPRFLCGLCRDVVDYRPPEIMVHDHERTQWSAEAAVFVEAKLAPLRPALLESPLRALYVSLRHSDMRVGTVVVKHDLQARPRQAPRGWRPWMGVDVSVRRTHTYPFTAAIRTGSVEVKDPVARVLVGEDWYFEEEQVTFRDPAEVFVYGAGSGMFKVLRKLRLVSGRASKVGMRSFGLCWLRDFRAGRGAA